MGKYVNALYRKAARVTTLVCGFLFAIFSFVYLYVFQRDVLEALHFSLAHGKTEYVPFASALVITLILILLRWGVNSLLGLKGKVRSLAYLPSFLILCALTDVGREVYMSGYHTAWRWLLPLLILLFVLAAYWLRRIFRSLLDEEVAMGSLVNWNIALLFFQCLLTVMIGNSDRGFHHELEMERHLRNGEYVRALDTGRLDLDAGRTLTALRAMAMTQAGVMGDRLFEYPQDFGSRGLFFADDSTATLRYTNDSLYHLLGGKPRAGETPADYLYGLCHADSVTRAAVDYYLSALLLDKRVEEFAQAVGVLLAPQDTLPRHYREAMTLYRSQHADSVFAQQDSLVQARYAEYKKLQAEPGAPLQERNRMKRNFGHTYWWYYDYQ